MRRIAFALAAASAQALAQGYPSKPITFIIPFAAGGDSDLSGRNVAQHPSKYLNNQPIVPVNRVGASGVMGAPPRCKARPRTATRCSSRASRLTPSFPLDSKVPYKWNEFTCCR
jgi:tripartite-type tricarboxylate transporter receptor subunit TctC